MDTSKEYIEMCSGAVEVQDKLPRNEDENGKKWVDGSTYTIKYDIETKRLIWLPRQDQLQDMLVKKYGGIFSVICRFCDWFQHEDYSGETITGEQLWLKFVMHELHGKQWDGEDWVKSPQPKAETPDAEQP